MWRPVSLNMDYVTTIRKNGEKYSKWLKLPENEALMKKQFNIPIAVVDIFKRSPKSDFEYRDIVDGIEYTTFHANPILSILKTYNRNLKLIPFKIELEGSGFPSVSSCIKKLNEVYDEVEKGKIRGVNHSITASFGIEEMLRVLDLDSSPGASDLIQGGMANLQPLFRKRIRKKMIEVNERMGGTIFPQTLKVISILEELAKKATVHIPAGNYTEPTKVNLYIFANRVQVVGALDKEGNQIYPYTYATKYARGGFDFHVTYKDELQTELSHKSITKNNYSCHANAYASALSYPGARTPKNIAISKKIAKRLRGRTKTLNQEAV